MHAHHVLFNAGTLVYVALPPLHLKEHPVNTIAIQLYITCGVDLILAHSSYIILTSGATSIGSTSGSGLLSEPTVAISHNISTAN